jgi:hypothetical protein
LVPGGVARHWKDRDTRQDLFLSVDEHPVSSRKVHPLGDGVPGLMSKVVLSSLSDERHAGEQSVVPTVVEVEVRVDDHHNIAEADPRAGKCLIERPVYRREEPIDGLVTDTDPGVHQHWPSWMVDHQTEHHTCSACPRMLIGKGHLTHKV